MSEIILHFKMNLYYLPLRFISVLSSKYRSYWAVESLGNLQSTSRGLGPVVKCKIHTIPKDSPNPEHGILSE
jgi:hypothetical protein